MQVMVLEDDPTFRAELCALLAWEGLRAVSFGDASRAKMVARDAILDLLVLGERIGGRLSHDVALLAEWRNPGIGTVLLSDRTGEAREELFELLPSLRAVLPAQAGAMAAARAALAVARSLGPADWDGARGEEDAPSRAAPAIRLPSCPLSELRPAPAPALRPPPSITLVPKAPPLAGPRRLHLG